MAIFSPQKLVCHLVKLEAASLASQKSRALRAGGGMRGCWDSTCPDQPGPPATGPPAQAGQPPAGGVGTRAEAVGQWRKQRCWVVATARTAPWGVCRHNPATLGQAGDNSDTHIRNEAVSKQRRYAGCKDCRGVPADCGSELTAAAACLPYTCQEGAVLREGSGPCHCGAHFCLCGGQGSVQEGPDTNPWP